MKDQGIELYLEGNTLNGIGRVLGYSAPAVPGWVKKGQQVLSRLVERGEERTAGRAGRQPAVVVSCDAMWTCRRARRGDKREEWWIWTAIGGWTSRWETVARLHFCGCTPDYPKQGCTGATPMRCIWGGFRRTGMW